MSTIVMRVDLDCDKCYKKIRKVLCKLQDKVSIKTISYDEKSKTVTVSGPFDAEEVADRLSSKAGSKVITDMHVVGGGGIQKHGAKPGNVVSSHGHGGGHGGGKPEKGYGGRVVGGKPEKGHGGHGGGKPEMGYGHAGHGVGKPEMGHGHVGHGGGGKPEKGHGGGGFGHKPEKKHVAFDDDMDDDDIDFDGDEPADRHGHHGNAKPRIFTTNTPVAARLEAPRTGPSMSMAAMAPMRMPSAMPPQQQPQPQGMGVPSIWPANPEWGYSAPAPQYGGWNGGSGAGAMPAAGGYYGGGPTAYGHGGYGAPAYGYGRNPYGPPPQYYEEEPSAACTVM